uniref:Complex 1 LYR protein domain-containing protein n=1 Tax=Neobodo designis TaxID=312471 RepID=A0A7S1W8X2_NEODS|mmetsp:Transcript_7138/g.22345  ORF Transcript_7138/g.22345 Transcript_7138/m.22345 type:complete len:189 (+) Transcript_7138:68-634(+)
MASQPTGLTIRAESLRLYRNLLKNAHRFPLHSRREIVSMEVKNTFRQAQQDFMENGVKSEEDLRYKLTLGWDRNQSIAKYAENMHWFHSRDEVTKEMLHFSQQRDQERVEKMQRFNEIGNAARKSEEVTDFKSAMYHTHPDYYEKVERNPLEHSRDLWRARGTHGSDTGGPRHKFYVKRYKAMFPQGW